MEGVTSQTNTETKDLIKMWCPLTKSVEGQIVGILSDTSLDRDEELISKELIKQWSKTEVLPALVDHQNSMETYIGGWSEFDYIEKGDRAALVAKPFFFSKDANPLAFQVENMVKEALAKGLPIGISIRAIPKASMKKSIGGTNYKMYTEAELLEATITPIQSNRNASFTTIAKSFDLDISKTKLDDSNQENISQSSEENTMEEKKFQEQLVQKDAEIQSLQETVEELKASLDNLPNVEELEKKFQERFDKLEKSAVDKPSHEAPPAQTSEKVEFSWENVVKAYKGVAL